MTERKRAPVPRTLEEVKAVFPSFQEIYMNRPPVIRAGLGMERLPRGKERFVLRVYLEQEPTEEQQRSLKKTFRGVPITYKLTGSFIAFGAESRWADPALQNLERWLTAHGADSVVAQSAPEDIWVFEAYMIVPYVGKPLPIGLTAQESTDKKHHVWAYIPTPSKKSEAVTEISDFFQELTDTNKAGSVLVFPTYHLEVIPDNATEDIETKVQDLAQNQGRDFIGVYRYDLGQDLATMMDPEDVNPWLDTPNTLTAGRKPREILGTDREWIVRDMIMDVRHGSIS